MKFVKTCLRSDGVTHWLEEKILIRQQQFRPWYYLSDLNHALGVGKVDRCSPEVWIDFRVTFTRPITYIDVFIRASEYTWMAMKHIIDHLPHTQSNTKIYESPAVRLDAYISISDGYGKLRYQFRTCHQNNLPTNLILKLHYWNGVVTTQRSLEHDTRPRHFTDG